MPTIYFSILTVYVKNSTNLWQELSGNFWPQDGNNQKVSKN